MFRSGLSQGRGDVRAVLNKAAIRVGQVHRKEMHLAPRPRNRTGGRSEGREIQPCAGLWPAVGLDSGIDLESPEQVERDADRIGWRAKGT